MISDFTAESLKYIIAISNGEKPEKPEKFKNTVTEIEAAEAIRIALQLLDINSQEFETVANDIGLENYCDLETFKLAHRIYKDTHSRMKLDLDETNEIIRKLVDKDIIGPAFNKVISKLVVGMILRLRLLSDYKSYVSNALTTIKNPDIVDIGIFA